MSFYCSVLLSYWRKSGSRLRMTLLSRHHRPESFWVDKYGGGICNCSDVSDCGNHRTLGLDCCL